MSKSTPHIVPRDLHSISRKQISPSALKVLYRLENAGHKAYLVGGCIRDLLLGLHPKDFDIATDAHPEQVHKLFSNSRLIGRRFKLVHILFGREVIEVATFRAGNTDSSAQQQTSDGMLTRDNVYGTIEEDAARRDFTANALYYSATDFCIYDYTDALDAINARQLILIGEPEDRYREDPVRMLRAIRFSEKLGFAIEQHAERAIRDHAQLMSNVAPARLFDEIIKLFVSGHGLAIFKRLLDTGLFSALFPAVAHTVTNDVSGTYQRFIEAGLSNTDKRIAANKPITPAFLYAVLLWPQVHREWQQQLSEGNADFPALQRASHRAVDEQLPHVMIPKRFILMMREIWDMQIRLTKNSSRRALQLIHQPRFRAGYDFLLLREQSAELNPCLGQWWTEFQEQNPVPTKERTRSDKSRPTRRRQPRKNKHQQT